MAIYAVRTQYTGFPGDPGFSTMYFVGTNESETDSSQIKAEAAHGLVAGFMADVFGVDRVVGDGLTFQVLSDVIARNRIDGAGLTQFSVTPVSGGSSGSLDNLPSANGMAITWRTGVFGPKGRGRTFLPPGSEAQNLAGTPTTTLLTNGLAHANALIAAAEASLEVNFVVWHRPTVNLPLSGSIGTVGSASITDQWAILKSRRD